MCESYFFVKNLMVVAKEHGKYCKKLVNIQFFLDHHD